MRQAIERALYGLVILSTLVWFGRAVLIGLAESGR